MIRNRKKRQMILIVCFMLGSFFVPASFVEGKTAKDAQSISLLEKNMLEPTTVKIQYRSGRIKSASYKKWYHAKKIAKTAKTLKIRKKGWYTLLVTTKKGKRTLSYVYFNKTTYKIPANNVVKLTTSWCYLEPKVNMGKSISVKKNSLTEGTGVTLTQQGKKANTVWKVVPDGKKKFRLQNANSKLYLGMDKDGQTIVQTTYNKKDKGQLFKVYAAGSYYYIRCEKNKKYIEWDGSKIQYSKRKSKKAWQWKLVEAKQPVSGAYITDGVYPKAIQEGAAFSLGGKIHSYYTIKKARVSVINGKGQELLSKQVSPGTISYDIKKVDAFIKFGTLPAGNYFYRIVVKDVNGASITVLRQLFTVTVRMPNISSTTNLGKTKTISYNSSLIAAVGHQSEGTSLEKKACASFALAYCNAILNSSAPSPHYYWLGDKDVSCVWSKGGYTCSSTGYGSLNKVLQEAYRQLALGYPCILNVKSTTSSEHWVCLVGYKNVTNLNALTEGNFLAIDPWNGKMITVSDTYSVKNTYRLGVKS